MAGELPEALHGLRRLDWLNGFYAHLFNQTGLGPSSSRRRTPPTRGQASRTVFELLVEENQTRPSWEAPQLRLAKPPPLRKAGLRCGAVVRVVGAILAPQRLLQDTTNRSLKFTYSFTVRIHCQRNSVAMSPKTLTVDPETPNKKTPELRCCGSRRARRSTNLI